MTTKITAVHFACGVRLPNGRSVTWLCLSEPASATIALTQDPLGNLVITDSAHPDKVTRVSGTTVLYTLEVVVLPVVIPAGVALPSVAAPKGKPFPKGIPTRD
jgi:hypothetical protein